MIQARIVKSLQKTNRAYTLSQEGIHGIVERGILDSPVLQYKSAQGH